MTTPDQTILDKAASSLYGLGGDERAMDPFPLFEQARSIGAVCPIHLPRFGTNQQIWMVTHMEEALQVLKDNEHFSNNLRPAFQDNSARRHGGEAPNASDFPPVFFAPNAIAMHTVDEPDHRRLRRLVSRVFTPKYIEGLRVRVQQIADELLDQVQEQGQMDLIDSYAYPLPINVISEMLGVPEKDRYQLRIWSETLAKGLGLGKHDEEFMAYMRAFGEYTAHLVAEKRLHPADDLISQLVAIEEGGDQFSEAEMISMITLLVFAGHETTSNLIAIGTLELLDHPDQWEMLKADPRLVPAAVEELLRFHGPVSTPGPRLATEDIELAEQQIKKGDMVIPVLLSANRDEIQFTQPDELDATRPPTRHIAFGYGIHTCLGAPLARLEGDIAFTTLLKRMPNLRLSVPRESITWHASLNLQSLDALPVAF